MKGLLVALSFTCVILVVQSKKENCSKENKEQKRDDIFSPEDVAEMHNIFKQNAYQSDEEVSAAFPVMDAFKDHSLFSSHELKQKTAFDYDNSDIESAVQSALSTLHKKKEEYEKVVKENTDDGDESKPKKEAPDAKKKVSAGEIIEEVVNQEIRKHKKAHGGDKTAKASTDEEESSSNDDDEATASSSSVADKKFHHKIAEISHLEEKLFHLIREVKRYLLKKKNELPEHHAADSIDDDDDVDKIMLNTKKRSAIPHVGMLEKFRKNPTLVDKYMDSLLAEAESDTEQGDQRDLLGKKDMETALLKQVVPGDIDSVPISRLDRESEQMESMATDRGIARDAMVESPFSVLDVKQTTGKRFRHNLS